MLRRQAGRVAVLTIRRPKALNALTEEVYRQLHEHFLRLRHDPEVEAVVLTGFGTKAFVAGADVRFLAALAGREEGVAASQRSQAALNAIERLGKPVIAALNGFALGGGCEIALCCTARIARRGLPLAVATPEANLGVVPGAGATQRLPRLIGFERAAVMLRTGRPLSGAEAVAWGLIQQEVDEDLVEAAVTLAQAAARGRAALPPLDPGPLTPPSELPPVELGHRSQVVDRLICRAILEGCRLPLAEGLRVESAMFGECCATEDMRIGVSHFLAHGPRSKAPFVHR